MRCQNFCNTYAVFCNISVYNLQKNNVFQLKYLYTKQGHCKHWLDRTILFPFDKIYTKLSQHKCYCRHVSNTQHCMAFISCNTKTHWVIIVIYSTFNATSWYYWLAYKISFVLYYLYSIHTDGGKLRIATLTAIAVFEFYTKCNIVCVFKEISRQIKYTIQGHTRQRKYIPMQ